MAPGIFGYMVAWVYVGIILESARGQYILLSDVNVILFYRLFRYITHFSPTLGLGTVSYICKILKIFQTLQLGQKYDFIRRRPIYNDLNLFTRDAHP